MKMRILPAVLLSLLVASVAFAANDRVVSVAGHKIKVSLPAGYSFETQRDDVGNARVTIENPVWEISITADVIAESDPKSSTKEWQEEKLVTIMANALSQSKEKDYKFQRLNAKKGSGTYCIFTDETLKKGQPRKPNDYVHMTGGIKSLRGCVIAFTIMSNDISSPEYREAFALFEDGFSE